ncbi:MAG TPA: prevent-host-death family protein, partial [Chloroflexota bacterium]|nr:prevent-host-death family protein [Chloroflexota bacterium]
RNTVRDVLRRVRNGEQLRVMVSGRPVAQLLALLQKPRFQPWPELVGPEGEWRADSALAGELRDLVPDLTDDPRDGH